MRRASRGPRRARPARSLTPHQRQALAGVALGVLAFLALVNGAVGFFGRSAGFLFSPFYLPEKLHALAAYARHRPACLLQSHPPLEPLARAAERKYLLPEGLLVSLLEVESEGEPHRISSAGAMGPAQLWPGTARLLHVEDPFDSAQAVDGAARYLALQLHRFGEVRLALAAYNAGPGHVEGQVPHNGETEFYVTRVMQHLAVHQAASAAERARAAAAAPAHRVDAAPSARREYGPTAWPAAPVRKVAPGRARR